MSPSEIKQLRVDRDAFAKTANHWIEEAGRLKVELSNKDKEIAELMAAATVDANVVEGLNQAVQTLALILAETRQDMDRLNREACFDFEVERPA